MQSCENRIVFYSPLALLKALCLAMTGSKKVEGQNAASDVHSFQEIRTRMERSEKGAAYFHRLFDDADKYLADSPLTQKASAFIGVRPSVLVAGLGLFLIVSLGTGLGGGLVCDVAGFLYPGTQALCAV